jgi:hypothetical protein
VNMSFERLRVQEYVESALGCTDLNNWPSYRASLEAYTLPHQDESQVRKNLLDDGEDLFYKGLLSLGEGLDAVAQKRHSWAAVKLYYSVFYFLRASLAAKGYAIIKNKSQYLFDLRAGNSPIKKSSKRFRNDHVAVINIYEEIVGDNDILSTNNIDGNSVYIWLMDRRHQVHYRQRRFLEPDWREEYTQAKQAIEGSKYSDLLDQYYHDDTPIYCFDPDHAIIAVPIIRAIKTRNDLSSAGLTVFSKENLIAAKSDLERNLDSNCSIWGLFDEHC